MFNKNSITILITCMAMSLSCISLADTTAAAATATINTSNKAPVLPIQHWTTSNGANVYFVAEHQLPMLDVEVILDAGFRTRW